MTVIKRDRNASGHDLIKALDQFIILLGEQGEDDAAGALARARDILSQAAPGSEPHTAAIKSVIDAFDEHELMAYTHARDSGGQWTDAEELALASTRVLSLARRFR